MLIVAVCLLVVALVPLCGRSLRRLGDLPLTQNWLVIAVLAVQTLVVSFPPVGPGWLQRALHVGSYVGLGVYLWLNRSTPWLWVVALGGGMNAVAITINRGVMPASTAALRAAGLAPEADYANSAVVDAPHFAMLGDQFNTPRGLPLANVFSIGDIVVVAGLAVVVFAASKRPPPAGTMGAPRVTRRPRAWIEAGEGVRQA